MQENSKHKALVGVFLYTVSEKYIAKLREKHPNANEVFKNLPQYTVSEEFCKLIDSEYYLQFVGMGEEEFIEKKFLLCDFVSNDPLFNNELENSDMETLFKDIDMKKILSVFTPIEIRDSIDFINVPINYIVFEIEWIVSKYPPDMYDCDVNYDVVGYLNNELNFVAY